LQGIVGVLEPIRNADATHLHYLLTAKFGVKMYEACLEWCEETTEALQKP
jgi:hypothetical protein